MITKQTDKIMKRPERLKGLPQQARYIGSMYMDEDEARELVQYFEGRISLWELGIDEITTAEKFTLSVLRLADNYSALWFAVEDFRATKLWRLFKAMDEWKEEHGATT